jgi:hypothetical protein
MTLLEPRLWLAKAGTPSCLIRRTRHFCLVFFVPPRLGSVVNSRSIAYGFLATVAK